MSIDDAFHRPVTLLTDRLQLRPMALSDFADIFEFKSDPFVTERYGQEPHRSPEETRAWVEKRVADQAVGDCIFWTIALRDEEKAIGECCFWNFTPSFRQAEVGYELHRSSWKKGLMAEALATVLEYGFGTIGFERVEAIPLVSNIDSQRLLRGLGFRQEGMVRDSHCFRGQTMDQVRYVLHNMEWADGRHTK